VTDIPERAFAAPQLGSVTKRRLDPLDAAWRSLLVIVAARSRVLRLARGKEGFVFTSLTRAAVAVCLVALVPRTFAEPRPKTIPLPVGFRPEGIVTTSANTFFVGSIPTGAILRGDLRTGEIATLVEAQQGRSAIGLAERHGVLFVAGGATGAAYAYDALTGEELANFQLTTGGSFINDVVATNDAAYFTDSVNPQIYRVSLGNDGTFGEPETVPLGGDLVYRAGFNANGIDATPDGKTLIVVQSNTGLLFTVDPQTGVSQMIDLGGETVVNGDGILLDGHRLWVVQNRNNLLTLVRLAPDLSSGEIENRFTDETFDVPTTLARAGDNLALVIARFGTPSPEEAAYWITQIPRPR
jgi:sugar lactone lactonase YvrE